MLKHYDYIPEGFTSCSLDNIQKILSSPSLIEIKGESQETLFLSVLLHGNETTGFYLAQKLLEDFKQQAPSKTVLLFVGNVEAAAKGLRFLDHQRDYNRIWKGGDTFEEQMATELVEICKGRKMFAGVDIHNNTGKNPFYACINKLRKRDIALATLFSSRIVFFEEPSSAQSVVLSNYFPAITVEASTSENPESLEKTYKFVKKLLSIKTLNREPGEELKVFSTVARILVRPDLEISFDEQPAMDQTLTLRDDIEELNFEELAEGEYLGHSLAKLPLRIIDNYENDVTAQYLDFTDNKIMVTEKFYPSMFTKNVRNIRADCLGYIMEETDLK